MNFFNELNRKVDQEKRVNANHPKKSAVRIARFCVKSCFKHWNTVKNTSNPYNSWLKILNGDGIDVTGNFRKQIDQWKIPTIPNNGHIYFDLKKALSLNPAIKKFGLIFFMGIGDYFYATNFIQKLKQSYPNIILEAFVSRNFDGNNSPLVGKCLKTNPNIAKVTYYDGHKNMEFWKNYDYAACYSLVNKDTLLLPMLYQYNGSVSSRTDTLCHTFGLERPIINPRPILYDYSPRPHVIEDFKKIKKRLNKVVFIQMTSRSTNFHYPYTDEIIKCLLDRGYFVLSVEPTTLVHDNLFVIDFSKYTITDSISLVKMIKEAGIDIKMLTTISCFASVSAALNILNLCMQHCYDRAIASVYYSNLYLIVHQVYDRVPSDRQFICPSKEQEKIKNMFVYSKEFVLNVFFSLWGQEDEK